MRLCKVLPTLLRKGICSGHDTSTHMHAHSVGLLLDGSAFILLGNTEPLAMEPIVDMPAVYVVAFLDILSNGEGGHLESARLDVAL